ncbi:hypothetical protein RclHR1_13210005 [Rhizophagus clarus]|uniref:F-box domain-containing protein n=1 Tax=Rhizophagus clarus TaxID=94130 RepID=A0A2Z6R1U6_9GLOM|nr:hypothetical protein RclHR1_13210005 [Rhizophagus clarus]GES79274.1 hypothetical protein GLOIN_2v1784886 [Rhizophagus clarus]
MACSKLFSGNLPELINEIMQYFRYDCKTLHSCILVNRLWCHLAIPLLWEDPFTIKVLKNYNFIDIYLHNLNDDDKAKLNEYVTPNNLFPSNTLFNYPSFIQHLDTNKVRVSIYNWITANATSKNKSQHSSYSMQNTNLSYKQMSDFTKLIYRLLFLKFIKNEVNLLSFKITMIIDEDFEYFDEIFELILQNPNFIYNIKDFILDFDNTTYNVTKFIEFLCSNCNSISSLYFLLPTYYDNYLIEKNLSQLIQSQEGLKKISLGYNKFPLYHLLLSLKNPNCSNTLNTIIFYHVDFKNIVILSEVFNQLNVLESIHIVYCRTLDSKFIQQINNITKPFKLRSLFLNVSISEELLESLIQKSGNYLENLGITNNESQLLLRLIIKYCRNIKYLGHTWLDKQYIYLLFDLIQNVTQSLNYLFIDYFYNRNSSSFILQNLGQALPFKLEFLNLCLTINTSDLELFLKNSQTTFIKKLLLRNRMNENGDIFPYIKEYIIKKKRVKYLAIKESYVGKSEDLFSQKDKVMECELHDIQVLNYNDLLIDIYDFIKETY